MGRVIGAVQRRIAVAASCSALAGLACATPDPFKIPAEQLRAQVDTVALLPLRISSDLAEEERLRPLIEPRALAMLRDGGFTVVPPDAWDQGWQSLAHESGEIWNPVTGERNDERFEAVQSELLRKLAAERGVDAIVHLNLFRQPVEGSGPSPLLCDVPRDVYWPDDLGITTRVTLAYGVCLQVEVYDMKMQELYRIWRGLEFVDTYALQTHASKPLDQRLSDPALLEEALTLTLGPLATRAKP